MKIRPATLDDVPALNALIALSGVALSAGFYTREQAEAITREVFGVDTQLVRDGTYYRVDEGGELVACGGWSKRSTPYGGDHAKTEPDALLDPARDAARIRAFFVHPGHARKGIGRMLLEHCASAAREAGFARMELTATLPGEPLYLAAGFAQIERFVLPLPSGVAVELVKMGKAL
ncbi:MAG: GNAT family N-acetyltransferase [Telluria sp.]